MSECVHVLCVSVRVRASVCMCVRELEALYH